MAEEKVRIGTAADRQAVIDVITLGFSTDPMTRWTLPAATVYLAVMPEMADAFGGKAFGLGSAYCVDDLSGAALWLPPGTEPDNERLGALMARHASATVRQAAACSSRWRPIIHTSRTGICRSSPSIRRVRAAASAAPC
jgi:hypothetical protein